MNPREWILRVISFDALSTTPGELTLILLTIVITLHYSDRSPGLVPPPPATPVTTKRRRATV